MKKSLIALAVLALTGCGTFGHTSYQVTTVKGDGGATTFDLKASDGKEFQNGRMIQFNARTGDFRVDEGPSKAFAGQAIGAKVLTVLPVNDLEKLVPAAPAVAPR